MIVFCCSQSLPYSLPLSPSFWVFLPIASYEESSCCKSAGSRPVRKGVLATNWVLLQKCIVRSFQREAGPQIAILLMIQVRCAQTPVPEKLKDNRLKLIQEWCFVSYHKNLILSLATAVVVQSLSCMTLCDPIDCSTPGFPGSLLSPRVCSDLYPLNWWCCLTLSCSVTPFSSCPRSFPASVSFPMSWLPSVVTMNLQGWFPRGLIWSPCCLRDSQASSPTPQFKSINSLVLSRLYGPSLTSLHDCWKNHSLDLCRQSNASALLICCLDVSYW